MAQAKAGDTVKTHYTGKLDDGTVFDTSVERDPLQFTIGERRLIQGFENAVIGMEPGQSKTVNIPALEAYGPHQEEMVVVLERSRLPEDLNPDIGDQLQINRPDGSTAVVTVTHSSDTVITLDANHPLAGKDLTFEIQLVEIE